MKIFLSASIPLPDRNPVFLASADVVAIRESIKGLVLILLENDGHLVFGGHPAITPLIRLLFHEVGKSPAEHVTLYQSRFFVSDFPPANKAFERIVITESQNGNREDSLHHMRTLMMGEDDYTSAVFIGGMEGVIDEYQMFSQLQPSVAKFPIASTGAAAAQIYREQGLDFPLLETELTYPTLFRKILRSGGST